MTLKRKNRLLWRIRVMRKVRILVIKTDEKQRMIVSNTLERAGYDVIRAKDTLEGLTMLFENAPDVVIMDSKLSSAAGKDARIGIRQAAYLPIIVCGDQRDTVESLDIGADAFLANPLNSLEMVARVRSLLHRKIEICSQDIVKREEN
jgi:DNA-binding response OmpR family regulator